MAGADYPGEEVPPKPIYLLEIGLYLADKYFTASEAKIALQHEPFGTLLSEEQHYMVMRIFLIERYKRDKARYVVNVR